MTVAVHMLALCGSQILTFLKMENRCSHLLGLFSSTQFKMLYLSASHLLYLHLSPGLYLCRLSCICASCVWASLFAECRFGGETYELEQTWHPDLGPPFNVMYCVHCECVPVSPFSPFLQSYCRVYFSLLDSRYLEWIPPLCIIKSWFANSQKVFNLINFLIPREKNWTRPRVVMRLVGHAEPN